MAGGRVEEIGRRFAASRAAWLRAAEQMLDADARLVAAMLTGSLGRRTSDAWSDVDLVVVVAADASASLVANRTSFVSTLGDAVFIFDSPWNAPFDGAQVNVLYDVGCEWPLYVDFDLWPQSRAAQPSDVVVLFDRLDLAPTGETLDEHRTWPRPSRPEPTLEHVLQARIAMTPIVAKCIVRHDDDRAHRMLQNLGYEGTAASVVARLRQMAADLQPEMDDRLAGVMDAMVQIAAREQP